MCCSTSYSSALEAEAVGFKKLISSYSTNRSLYFIVCISASLLFQGVFAFKRGQKRGGDGTASTTTKTTSKKRSKKKNKKFSAAGSAKMDDTNFFGTDDNAKLRKTAYEATWARVSEVMTNLQREVFDNVLTDVIKFCETKTGSNPMGVSEGQSRIPTCALVTGVNLPDHDDLFKLIRKELKTKISPHVAMVRSADVNNLKAMVKRLVLGLHKVR